MGEGEGSFWYRPTRVVPDQRPLNGRCCKGRQNSYLDGIPGSVCKVIIPWLLHSNTAEVAQ